MNSEIVALLEAAYPPPPPLPELQKSLELVAADLQRGDQDALGRLQNVLADIQERLRLDQGNARSASSEPRDP